MRSSLVLVACSVLLAQSQACCITFADAAKHLAKETAAVFWDPERGIEHFIRKSEFSGDAETFGFIFPSPSEPFRIEVADDDVFGMLESLRPKPFQLGCAASDSVATAAEGVRVLQSKDVGDYRVDVLQAKDGNALGAWLANNGHRMRPAMRPWLDYYAEKGWILSAFRYHGKGQQTTKAVSISFRANTPHYPYRMPDDTFEPNHFRKLDLFVVAPYAVDGVHNDGSPWRARREWTSDFEPLSGMKRLLGFEVPSGMVVTRFTNTNDADNYAMDLTFPPQRPPAFPWLMGLGALMGIAAYSSLRRR